MKSKYRPFKNFDKRYMLTSFKYKVILIMSHGYPYSKLTVNGIAFFVINKLEILPPIFLCVCSVFLGRLRARCWGGGGVKDKGQVFDEERELLPAKSIHSPLYIQTYICSVEILFVGILKFYLHNVAFSATEK